MRYIRCYHPPVNKVHLANYILVPEKDVYEYTKKLYEEVKMSDPTYVIKDIKSDPIWYMAWIISEHLNDNAPIGWSRYISIAKSILEHLSVNIK